MKEMIKYFMDAFNRGNKEVKVLMARFKEGLSDEQKMDFDELLRLYYTDAFNSGILYEKVVDTPPYVL